MQSIFTLNLNHTLSRNFNKQVHNGGAKDTIGKFKTHKSKVT